MSNEELVAAVRAGEDRWSELWEQVCGLVKWKAKRIMTVLEGCPGRGVEFEDLMQSGYLALEALPEQSAEVLRLRHYRGLTLAGIGEIQGTTPERVRQIENKAIRLLRKPSIACHLRPFYDFDFYCGTSLRAFQNSGMSVQERYLVIEEEQKERAEQRRRERILNECRETLEQIR